MNKKLLFYVQWSGARIKKISKQFKKEIGKDRLDRISTQNKMAHLNTYTNLNIKRIKIKI